MSVKPILFNTDMVRAIQDNRKTVTRRVVKPQPDAGHEFFGINCMDSAEFVLGDHCCEVDLPYLPGDILWVRETWSTTDTCGLFPPWPSTGTHYIYKAELEAGRPYEKEGRWFPSIHMPRKAARIFLRVKSVRVEHLKDITDEQAIAEGARYTDFGMFTPRGKMSIDGGRTFHPFKPIHHPGYHFKDVVRPEQCFDYPWLAFANYWGKTISPADLPRYCWDANPWVWVIEFEKCEKPEGWCE